VKIAIISIGRERADTAAPMVLDYLSRISKFLPIEEVVLRQDRDDRVAARILQKTQDLGLLVALDEAGKTLDSHEFSSMIETWMNTCVSKVSFVIGGADGLPSDIRNRADVLLSLSRMTLPHRLARLFLAEQIYRGLCIIRRVPYQK
jgi:23S rRNA (pseudouridine1915-N3)-methyltransferase